MDKAIQTPSGSAAEALAAGIMSVQPVRTKTTVVTLTSITVSTALNPNDSEASGGRTLGPPADWRHYMIKNCSCHLRKFGMFPARWAFHNAGSHKTYDDTPIYDMVAMLFHMLWIDSCVQEVTILMSLTHIAIASPPEVTILTS